MLNMKRFIIILLVLLSVFTVLVGSSLYFLNVNDDSSWLSRQIQQSTGYGVRFEGFENNWLAESSISLKGLSLYQQQQRVLYINRLELKVDKLDLLQRQLSIKSLHLEGVDVDIRRALKKSKNDIIEKKETKNQVNEIQNLAWEKLQITTLKITDLNAKVQHLDQKLILKEASIELNDLLIIDNKQLHTLPKRLAFTTQFNHLQLSNPSHKAVFNKVKLSTEGDLFKRQAKLELNAGEIDLQVGTHLPVVFESLQLELQLVQNKLSLVNFFVNTFSGTVAANADAILAIGLLPKPTIKVQQVILNSLVAKELQLTIPELPLANTQGKNNTKNKQLPITAFQVKKVRLQNVNLHSEATQLPLTVTSMHLDMRDFYIIKENKLLDASQLTQQAGRFSLAFDQLQWRETLIEKFSVAGSMNEKDKGIQVLKQLLTNN